MKRFLYSLLCTLLCVAANAQFDSAPAFPGAEGYGRYTTGGRGGTVYHVTTLEDYCDNTDYSPTKTKDSDIKGSLRYGVKQSGARIIVFDVAGTIELKAPLKIQNDNITILGQTAPGDGICLKNFTVNIAANNVIIRYIRCRLGNDGRRYYNSGSALSGSDQIVEDDAMNAYQKTGSEKHNVIIDHCSISWSVDECGSFYGNQDFTLQWCIMSESLRNAGHTKGNHGYGGIWGGERASFHHNLLADHDSRNPRFDHGYVSTLAGPVDYTNNVLYNWGSNSAYGGENKPGETSKKFNMINNYYRYGGATSDKDRLLNPTTYCTNCSSSGTDVVPGTFYISGNYMYGSSTVTNDNTCSNAIVMDSKGKSYSDWKGGYVSNTKFKATTQDFASYNTISLHTAENTYNKVLQHAGASLKRDAVDTRVCNDAKNATTSYTTSTGKGTNGATGGFIDMPSDVGGYPTLTGTKATDTDGDGIPDEWEDEHDLDKCDASDALTKTLDTKYGYYTNLEVYANYLVQHITKAERAGATETFEEYYPLDSDDPAPTQTVITASPASVNITGTANTTVTLSSNNTSGAYSITSQPNASVATASISGNTITITGVAAGSTSLTVTQAASTGFTSATKTINITVSAQGGGDTPAAGTLTWDYTSAAPSSSPDNNLYYNQNVNDAAGTNNGLKGVKMDSNGYAYFTKPAVAGTLSITYGVRKDNNTLSLNVYSTATAGVLNTSSDELVKTSTASSSQIFDVNLSATQNNIYIKRASGSEGVITKIVFTPATPDHDATYDKNLGNNTYTVASGDKAVSGTMIVGTDITMTYGNNDTWKEAAQESTKPSGYDYYISSNDGNPSPSNGSIPTSGCYYKFEPTKNGTLNVAMLVSADKAIYVVEDGTSIGYKIGGTSYSAGSSLSEKTGNILSFPVTAGKTYYVYAAGSKLGLFGWTLTEDSGDDDGDIESPDPVPVAVKPAAKKVYDFVVGRDGTMDEAIAVANAWTGSGRYLIFVPDGTHNLTATQSWTLGSDKSAITGIDGTTVQPGSTFSNNATWLDRSNVSIIGQSMDKTKLQNKPNFPGISYTSTLEIRNGKTNTYIQDLTLYNNYADGRNDKGVAVAFYDRGTNTILKNVSAWSNQDTYTSAATRCYYETSTFAGTVDFICGSGDVWFERCNLVINDRSTANVITAPSTTADQEWGYVFNSCTINPENSSASSHQGGKYNLGRPWKLAPASTFINTKMNILPSDKAWTGMNDGLTVRFHEYGSTNSSGTAIDLSTRSISDCKGNADSEKPVLNEAQASKYKVSNVLAGDNNWDPRALTLQTSVSNVQLNGSTLSWDNNDYALCWVVFKDGVFYDDVTENSITLSESGTYTVRAANSMGGLGEASAGVSYTDLTSGGAVLAFTAAVQGGSNAAGSTLNQETHYYNNWGSSAWAAQAYIGFNVAVPAGKQIKSATLKFTSYCGGNNATRTVDVYGYLGIFNYESLSLINKPSGNYISTETDYKDDPREKVVTVTDFVKSNVTEGSTTSVVFVLGGAAAGGTLYGKASSSAPTLDVEFEDIPTIQSNIIWDFSKYTEQISPNNTLEYSGLTLVGNNGSSSDYVSASAGFHMNGTSTTTTRYIKYTPQFDGTITVSYKSNNATANDRITAIGTEVVKGTDVETLLANPKVLAAGVTEGATIKTISADLTAGTTYYLYFANGGQAITKIEYSHSVENQNTLSASVLSTRKFSSFSSLYNVDFGTDENAAVQAYTVKVKDASTVVLTRHYGVLPAGEGVVLYAPDATKSQTFYVTASATALTIDNDMIGVPVATNVEMDADEGHAYVVNSDAFRPLSASGTIAAGKAYIRIPSSTGGAKAISMIFNDEEEATSISNYNFFNTNLSNMKIYNLQGIEVKNPIRGHIYIINNKKCIFK